MTTKITLLITTLLSALISGFFYAYVCSVNPGLSRLTDLEYLRSMQSINKAVLNPVFFASFFGCLLMLSFSTLKIFLYEGRSETFYLVLSSAVIYMIGVFLITGRGNVPLNEALSRIDLSSSSIEVLKHQRLVFEESWNRFNLIRTIASISSLILLLIALIKIR